MDIGDKTVATAKATVTTVVKPLDLLLIRDDTYLCMGNIDILALNPRLRIYHGKLTDSWDVRKKFLDGQGPVFGLPALDPSQVDVTRMSREQLIEHALDEYGVALDADTEYAHALVAVIKARSEREQEQEKKPAAKGGVNSKGIAAGITH